MSPWLRRILVDKGVMDHQGVTRRARVRRHPSCGMPTLAGFDSHVLAWTVWLDLTELSRRGEALAILDGRRTYELWVVALGFEIEHRDRWRVAGHPADTPGTHPVLCDHRCSAPVPRSWASQHHHATYAPDPTNDIPPF
jgi:hypothetical protein